MCCYVVRFPNNVISSPLIPHLLCTFPNTLLPVHCPFLRNSPSCFPYTLFSLPLHALSKLFAYRSHSLSQIIFPHLGRVASPCLKSGVWLGSEWIGVRRCLLSPLWARVCEEENCRQFQQVKNIRVNYRETASFVLRFPAYPCIVGSASNSGMHSGISRGNMSIIVQRVASSLRLGWLAIKSNARENGAL